MIAVRRHSRPERRHARWLVVALVLAVAGAFLLPQTLANARPYAITSGGSIGLSADSGDPMSMTMLTIDEAVWQEVAGRSVLTVLVTAECRWGLFTAGTWSFTVMGPGRAPSQPLPELTEPWARSLMVGGTSLTRRLAFETPRTTTRLTATDPAGTSSATFVIPPRRHRPVVEPTSSAAPLLELNQPIPVGSAVAPGTLTLTGYNWQPEDAFPGVHVRLRLGGAAGKLLPRDRAFTAATATGAYQQPFNSRFEFAGGDDVTAAMDFTIDAGGGLIVVSDGEQVVARIWIPAA